MDELEALRERLEPAKPEVSMTLDMVCAACSHPQANLRFVGTVLPAELVDVEVACAACSASVIFRGVELR